MRTQLQAKTLRFEAYLAIANALVRNRLLKEPLEIKEGSSEADIENMLASAIIPALQKLLDKSLYHLYQVLYAVDVDERYLKERITDLENTAMIPSIIAFAIIDRMKIKYAHF